QAAATNSPTRPAILSIETYALTWCGARSRSAGTLRSCLIFRTKNDAHGSREERRTELILSRARSACQRGSSAGAQRHRLFEARTSSGGCGDLRWAGRGLASPFPTSRVRNVHLVGKLQES